MVVLRGRSHNRPDHFCGGSPLYEGEIPQGAAGAVGSDNPFPESGVTPASFLYAFIGVEAHTSGLAITPNLSCPSGVTFRTTWAASRPSSGRS
jgi:hypothetical protein